MPPAAGDKDLAKLNEDETLAGANFDGEHAKLLARAAYSDKLLKPENAADFPLVEFIEHQMGARANDDDGAGTDRTHPSWLRDQSTLIVGATRVLDLKQEVNDRNVQDNYENMRQNYEFQSGGAAAKEKKDGPTRGQRKLDEDVPDDAILDAAPVTLDWSNLRNQAKINDITLAPDIVPLGRKKNELDVLENEVGREEGLDVMMVLSDMAGAAGDDLDFGAFEVEEDSFPEAGGDLDQQSAKMSRPDSPIRNSDRGAGAAGGAGDLDPDPFDGGGGDFHLSEDPFAEDPPGKSDRLLPPATPRKEEQQPSGQVPGAPGAESKLGFGEHLLTSGLEGGVGNASFIGQASNMQFVGGGVPGLGAAASSFSAGLSSVFPGPGTSGPADPNALMSRLAAGGPGGALGSDLSVPQPQRITKKRAFMTLNQEDRIRRIYADQLTTRANKPGTSTSESARTVLSGEEMRGWSKKRRKFTLPINDSILNEFHHLGFPKGGRSQFSLLIHHHLAEDMIFHQTRRLWQQQNGIVPSGGRGAAVGAVAAQRFAMKPFIPAAALAEEQESANRKRARQDEQEEEFAGVRGTSPKHFNNEDMSPAARVSFGGADGFSPAAGSSLGGGFGFSPGGRDARSPPALQKKATMHAVVAIEAADEEGEAVVGYSARTEKMHCYISQKLKSAAATANLLDNSSEGEGETRTTTTKKTSKKKKGPQVSYRSLCREERFEHMQEKRKAIAGCFFEMLVLKTHSVIDVEQATPFGDIIVSHGKNWTEDPEVEAPKPKQAGGKKKKEKPSSPLQKAFKT
ncbi:unnamed protein product [Amoebophrya sp. A25]|nr:unnamed protein product [Amoebophrya sp. A25]|eukprot:GSA25T00010409001.1